MEFTNLQLGQTQSMSRRLVGVIIVGLAFAFSSCLVVPNHSLAASQLGRFVDGKYYFYFGGSTRDSKHGKEVDPLNVVFYSPYDRYGEREVAKDIEKVIPDYEDYISDSSQWIFYTTARGRGSDIAWNEVDKALATHRAIRSRDHIRLWGDDESAALLGRPSGVWVVGGVHHDKFVGSKLNHKVDKDWDYSRRRFAKQMRWGSNGGRCVDAKWRRHPGARGWFGDKSNDDWYHHSTGILSRITMQSRDRGCQFF